MEIGVPPGMREKDSYPGMDCCYNRAGAKRLSHGPCDKRKHAFDMKTPLKEPKRLCLHLVGVKHASPLQQA